VSFSRACAGERAQILAVCNLPPAKLETLLSQVKADNNSGETGAADPNAPENLPVTIIVRNIKSQCAFAEETFNRALVIRHH